MQRPVSRSCKMTKRENYNKHETIVMGLASTMHISVLTEDQKGWQKLWQSFLFGENQQKHNWHNFPSKRHNKVPKPTTTTWNNIFALSSLPFEWNSDKSWGVDVVTSDWASLIWKVICRLSSLTFFLRLFSRHYVVWLRFCLLNVEVYYINIINNFLIKSFISTRKISFMSMKSAKHLFMPFVDF